MKFQFCGGLDVPEWLLRELAELSKLSCVRVRILAQQILNELAGEASIDYEKVDKLLQDSEIEKKGVLAALHYILSNAIKYAVEEKVLSGELQQLGLPTEHCVYTCRVYQRQAEKIRAQFKNHTLRFARVEKVEWRLDYVLSSKALKNFDTPTVQMNWIVQKPTAYKGIGKGEKVFSEHSFEISSKKLRVLLNELKNARETMNTI